MAHTIKYTINFESSFQETALALGVLCLPIREWCEETFGEDAYVVDGPYYASPVVFTVFTFKNESDAALFTLKWL